MTQLRAVIYARYSSDLQRQASIEDQNEVCRRYIKAMGWQLVNTYADAAMSGATRHRPALQNLISEAKRRAFDVVVCEAVDRLGRRLADTSDLQDTLSFLGIRLHTPSIGEVTALHVGIMGMMAQLTLKDLAEKTRRGQLGRVRQGKIPGGLAYGYNIVDGNGKDKGHREINREEAKIVRRIFEEFASGKPPEKIARDLNKEGAKGPFGRAWSNTTIRGQAKRGNGILNNEIYVGKLSWNRCSYIKDPSTGKRAARPNPREKWEVSLVPNLRIVDDDLWDAVKRRQHYIRTSLRGAPASEAGSASLNLNATHRPRYLLSGLIKCAECGGNLIISGRDHLSCSNRHRKGTCSSSVTVRRREIEGRVIDGLKEKLVTSELVDIFINEFQLENARLQGHRKASRKNAIRKLDDIDQKVKAMTKAIEDGFYHPEMKERLTSLTSEREMLLRELKPTDDQGMILVHPRLPELFKQKVAELSEMLEGANAEVARELLRSLIEKVTIMRDGGSRRYQAVLFGELAAILAVGQNKPNESSPKSELPGTVVPGSQLSVVAGARFELTTFRL